MRRVLTTLLTIVLGAFFSSACGPDLSRWQIVRADEDASVLPGVDAGPPQVRPVELGTPCPNPHIAVTLLGPSGTDNRVLRINPQTNERCRASDLLEVQGVWQRDRIWSTAFSPELGLVLGTASGVIRLGPDGFPQWHYVPYQRDGVFLKFDADFVAASNNQVVLAWTGQTSELRNYMVLDANGNPGPVGEVSVFSSRMMTEHPDGSGRYIIAGRFGEMLAYAIGRDGETIHSSDGVAFLDDEPNALEGRSSMQSDLSRGVLAIGYRNGVRVLSSDAVIASWDTSSQCSDIDGVAADPSGTAGEVYAVCETSGARHLVHITSELAEVVVDGSSLGSSRILNVVGVHQAL